MKLKIQILTLFLISLMLLCNIAQTQVISPMPISAQLPTEILAGLLGKYLSMIQQYYFASMQGQYPDSAMSMRIAASIDVSSTNPADTEIAEPALSDISKLVFWANTNIFAKQLTNLSVDLSSSFGNIKFIITNKGAIIASYDEGIYAFLPSDMSADNPKNLVPEGIVPDGFLPESILPFDLIQELTPILLEGLADFNVIYEGLLPTPRGMAHIVKLIPLENDMILTLCILDKTWDLCKLEFIDAQNTLEISIMINQLELVTVVPDSEFVVDTSMLTEISYDDFIALMDLKLNTAIIVGSPVVSDLYVSAPKVLQEQEISIISNALDSQDKEADLLPSFEYKSPDGIWKSLDAEYIGTSPFGNWKAVFKPSIDDIPGKYSFRVSYIDSSGNASDVFELPDAIEVIAVPPQILQVSIKDRDQDVPVSTNIKFVFSNKIEEASIESSFILSDSSGKSVQGLFEWQENSLIFKPSQELKYSQTYTLKILGSARGINGALLDSNGNGIAEGSPKDDLSIQFITESYPTIAVEGLKLNKEITQGEMLKVNIVAQSISNLGSFTIEIKFEPSILSAFSVERASFADWRPRPKDIGEHDIWSPIIIDNQQGKIIISANKTTDVGVSGTGVLAKITFDTIGVGESIIGFNEISLLNISGKPIQHEKKVAKVSIGDFLLYDANKDGIVDVLDFIKIKPDGNADLNNDGIVDILDIVTAMGKEKDAGIWDANSDGIVDIRDFIKIQIQKGIEPDANGDGIVDILDIVYILGGAKKAPNSIPIANALGESFPNPMNPEVWIPFRLASASDVVIRIYNSKGQIVRNIDLGYRNPGNYITRSNSAYWDGLNENGESVPSGVYFYNIKAGNFSATKKMVVQK